MNRLARRRQAPPEERFMDVFDGTAFSFNGQPIWARPMMSMSGSKVDEPSGSFESMVRHIHDRHPVISAAVAKRAQLISQVRFKWRSLIAGDNGRLWGDQSLGLLEVPNESQTRSNLLRTASHHVDYAGTAFFHRVGSDVRLLHPDRVSVLLGSNLDPDDPGLQADAQVVGYLYRDKPMADPELIPADEVAAWSPEPDPICWWRGTSWAQAVITDFVIDRAAHLHVTKFFENAATPQMVFSFDSTQTVEQLKAFADVIKNDHSGAANAYRNLFLGGGADAKVVGADLKQLDLHNVMGLTETRIAVRSQVPAVVLGISEGLQGSALNSGNYSQTRRLWADSWFTPAADDLCATLETILPPPAGSELSFDPAQIMFLQDDRLDEANVKAQQASTMRQLIDAGFDPSTVVNSVISGDYSNLAHSGLFSVQLHEAGSNPDVPAVEPPARSEPVQVYLGDTTVNVPESPAPVVNVDARQEAPVVNVDARTEPTQITVERSDTYVTNDVHVPEPGPVTKTVTRDENGYVSKILEERV